MIEAQESRPSIVKQILGLIVGIPFLLMLAFFFLLGPYQLFFSCWDLLQMDQESDADIKAVKVVHGNRGTSRTDISYSFPANGQLINSNRVFPGPADNSTYTGGSDLTKKFSVGMKSRVYFDSNNPSCCCLEFGWHKISVAMTMLAWGIAALIICISKGSKYVQVPLSIVIYGFGLFMFGPHAVEVAKLHLHLIAFAVIAAAVFFYNYFRPLFKLDSSDSSSPLKENSAAANSAEEH